MKKLLSLYRRCAKSESAFWHVLLRSLFIKLIYRKLFFLHQNVTIKGIKNIETNGKLEVGINYVGFIHKSDKTYLNINGKLKFKSSYSIGRGCRFDIGKDAVVSIGSGGYINSNTNLIIMHNLTIGDNCIISWNCQFLDDDFHEIRYDNKKSLDNSIIIGNNVWIGCGAQIYKGAVIPDGCVVASNSVVRGRFTAENAIIGGNPARIIKDDITWC